MGKWMGIRRWSYVSLLMERCAKTLTSVWALLLRGLRGADAGGGNAAGIVGISSYLVDPASSHMLVSKIKPCMSKYKQVCTVKLRMAH
jgi:hypothetical protein